MGSTAPFAAFYMYSPDRKGEHAATLLGSCRGFLHADGYSGFRKLYERVDPDTGQDRLRWLWAHAPPSLRRACRHQLRGGTRSAGSGFCGSCRNHGVTLESIRRADLRAHNL
jgi:Transposase IS66 family